MSDLLSEVTRLCERYDELPGYVVAAALTLRDWLEDPGEVDDRALRIHFAHGTPKPLTLADIQKEGPRIDAAIAYALHETEIPPHPFEAGPFCRVCGHPRKDRGYLHEDAE